MGRTSKKSAATKELLRQVSKRSTGKLTIGAGAASTAVYVMNGDVVAAESGEDGRQLIRRFHLLGGLATQAVSHLESLVESGEPFFGELLDNAAPHLVDPILAERFRDNVARFVGSAMTPTFEAQLGVFVENLQIGHNSAQLITSCCAMWDTAETLDLDLQIVPGISTDDPTYLT